MKKYVFIFWAFISLPTFSFSEGCPTENIKIKEGDSYFILHLGFTNKDSYGFGEVKQEDITLFISKNLIKRTLKNSYLGEGLWIHGDYKYKGREFAHGGWKQRDLFKDAILRENSNLKYPENGVVTTNFSSKSCITNVLERIVQNLNPGHIVLIEEFTYEENDKWNTFSTVESAEVAAFVKSYNNSSGNNVQQTLMKENPITIADYKTISNNDFLEIYEKGRLHYNNAAKLKLYELPKYQDDYTKQGEDNFTALVSQIHNHLRRALPFFQKAESINPNDENTLIALTEIFVDLGEFDKAQLFKDRLKKVQSGITLTSSYF